MTAMELILLVQYYTMLPGQREKNNKKKGENK